jgi:hypothetical protein
MAWQLGTVRMIDWFGIRAILLVLSRRSRGSGASGVLAVLPGLGALPVLGVWGLFGLLGLLGDLPVARGEEASQLAKAPYRITWFEADISPPLGKSVDIGFRQAMDRIEHPALAKGIVLEDDDHRYVLCAVDYSGLCNESHRQLRQRIADAAETEPSRVALQALHQHTTVCLDADAAQLLYQHEPERLEGMMAFEREVAERIAQAVRASRTGWKEVTHVGLSQARVERVASSRRLPQEDGTIIARLSSTQDPVLRELPEGLIDPWLKTVTFFAADQPLAQLHYYATHPQSFYGDNRCTWDVPGIARQRLEAETGVFQIYFTGCGGNVAMGKYNNGTLEARQQLADRLYNAMSDAASRPERQAAQPIAWRTEFIQFPLRTEVEFQPETCRRIVEDQEERFPVRLKAAMCLAWSRRNQAGTPVELSCLVSGSLRILHLPGEPFVEYQLAAQRMVPDEFLAVAGYGDCAMWYIGPDTMYQERGGYEQSWSFVGPCEQLLRDKMKSLLSRDSAGQTRSTDRPRTAIQASEEGE